MQYSVPPLLTGVKKIAQVRKVELGDISSDKIVAITGCHTRLGKCQHLLPPLFSLFYCFVFLLRNNAFCVDLTLNVLFSFCCGLSSIGDLSHADEFCKCLRKNLNVRLLNLLSSSGFHLQRPFNTSTCFTNCSGCLPRAWIQNINLMRRRIQRNTGEVKSSIPQVVNRDSCLCRYIIQ